MKTFEIKMPDVGDAQEVTLIEWNVQEGQAFKKNQTIMSVETSKAVMEIPAPQDGILTNHQVQVNQKIKMNETVAWAQEIVSEGPSTLQVKDQEKEEVSHEAKRDLAESWSSQEKTEADYDVVVIGGGPGGYSAAFRAADLGLNVALIEKNKTLGGVCLNVGCIPSKALLHVTTSLEHVRHLQEAGVSVGEMKVDLDQLRGHKNKVVGKLTQGLKMMAQKRNVSVIEGEAFFKGEHELEVRMTTSKEIQNVTFKYAIIAAGSQPVTLEMWNIKDQRVVDSTGALDLPFIPKKMLVVGGGVIGLEMATVYQGLGAKVDIVERGSQLVPGSDKDVIQMWEKSNQKKFNRIMKDTQVIKVNPKVEGVEVFFESLKTSVHPESAHYDLILVAVGRKPNGHLIQAQKAGVKVNERGFIEVDVQMRSNQSHILAIGDVTPGPMLAHRAVHQGHVAAEVVASEILEREDCKNAGWIAKVIPGVAYTDPEIAWVGITEEEAIKNGIAYKKGVFPWAASGRALANGRTDGMTKLIFEEATGRIIGGAIVGPQAGDMLGEIALAIEMGADAIDMGRTIHPHPTLGETLGLAAEEALGHCTDLPPKKH